MKWLVLFMILCPMYVLACGPNAHPDVCQGAVCGTEQDIRDWLEKQKGQA